MSVSRDEVRRIAHLAQLDVEDEALDALAADMSRILDYVAHLQQVAGGEPARSGADEAAAVRFRPDVVKPAPLATPPDHGAPAFEDGFFVVPRLGQFEEDGA